MSDHRIELTITGPDIDAKLICSALVCSKCRLECAEDCGAETWPCFTYNADGTETEHERIDGGGCIPIEWINNSDGAIEHHSRESHDLVAGPIDFEWNGDDYLWKYAS